MGLELTYSNIVYPDGSQRLPYSFWAEIYPKGFQTLFLEFHATFFFGRCTHWESSTGGCSSSSASDSPSFPLLGSICETHIINILVYIYIHVCIVMYILL